MNQKKDLNLLSNNYSLKKYTERLFFYKMSLSNTGNNNKFFEYFFLIYIRMSRKNITFNEKKSEKAPFIRTKK